jgi:1-acyl-sn-glycerol-3-phosphate acyltransferase
MNKQMDEGINIGIFPEGTRLLISKMKEGTVLGEFEEGAFFLAWKKQVPVQPIVFDFPAIFRGKKDDRWGVHPCVIDIHYLNVIRPDEKDEFSENKYKSLEEFQLACFQVMETKLKSSKKVQNFLKEIKER